VKVRTSLNGCPHSYCYECIKKWTEDRSNTCPLCKRLILTLSYAKDNVIVSEPVSDKHSLDFSYGSDAYDDESFDVCSHCGGDLNFVQQYHRGYDPEDDEFCKGCSRNLYYCHEDFESEEPWECLVCHKAIQEANLSYNFWAEASNGWGDNAIACDRCDLEAVHYNCLCECSKIELAINSYWRCDTCKEKSEILKESESEDLSQLDKQEIQPSSNPQAFRRSRSESSDSQSIRQVPLVPTARSVSQPRAQNAQPS
jgi:hypothetical protein